MRRLLTVLFCCLLVLVGCSTKEKESAVSSGITVEELKEKYPDARVIVLSGASATLDGKEIAESDYTWHCDPTSVHDEVKNAPAEYYTGEKLSETIRIDHDLSYYPEADLSEYQLVSYDGEREYARYYDDGVNDEYIFATLPAFSAEVLRAMMHSEEEASNNKVLHIEEGGTYILTGDWKGQVAIDAGDERVTLILDNAKIECSVAPALVFYSAYECGGEFGEDFNTEDAGAVVVLEGENKLSGCNIFRMLKNVYKSEDSDVQKKVRKIDSPFYSFVTMNVMGEGSLEVTSNFEGMGTEMHLSFLGGSIEIFSGDDGINVNEDNVSVVSFLGGSVQINHKEGREGDGVDSNGYIVVNGGDITVNGVTSPDNALDSEDGVFYTAGKISADGEEVEVEKGQYHSIDGQNQSFGNGQFGKGRPEGRLDTPQDERGNFDKGFGMNDFNMKEFKEKVAALDDNDGIEKVMEILGMGQFH